MYIGAEYDRKAIARLKKALKKAGAVRKRRGWVLFGSQEIIGAEFIVKGRVVSVESETYMGIHLRGDEEAVSEVSRFL